MIELSSNTIVFFIVFLPSNDYNNSVNSTNLFSKEKTHMKKLTSILLALSMAVSLTVAISANTTGETSTASYATVAPVIDGQIDEIWNHTAHQNIAVPDDFEYDITGGYTALLWDETGYYLLAVVEDISLTENDQEARNSVDFWFSEANTKTDSFSTDSGDWHFCKASDGTECYYTGNENVYKVAKSAVTTSEDGYIVELYVPFLGAKAPALGAKIGYTVSFNDDVDNDGVRDGYVFWSVTEDSDAYWENTSALPNVELVAGPTLEELGMVPETTAEIVDAVVSETVVNAPKTFDAGILAAVAAIVSAAGYTICKKH